MNRISEKDPKVAALIAECERLGIQHDTNQRWENGVPHHPEAERIYSLLSESDWAFGDDHFCWKEGGDGDNGEDLMFSLSVLLELRDAQAKESLEKAVETFNAAEAAFKAAESVLDGVVSSRIKECVDDQLGLHNLTNELPRNYKGVRRIYQRMLELDMSDTRPTIFVCEDCEITWPAQDCDHGNRGGAWFAHCPNCRREIYPPKKEES